MDLPLGPVVGTAFLGDVELVRPDLEPEHRLDVLPAGIRDGDLLDLAKAARVLRTPVARTASDEEVGALASGRAPGAMPPIRELIRMPVYADHAIEGDRDIAFRSGSLEWAVRRDRAVWEEISGVMYADLMQQPGELPQLPSAPGGRPATEHPGAAPRGTMGATVRSPEAPSPHGTAHDRRAALAALDAVLPTVLPEATERSLVALARQAQVRPFRRHEQVLSQSRDPLLTLVVDGHLGAVRSDADGRQQMITIAGPGELVGVLSLRPDAPSVDLVGLNRGTAAVWPGDLVLALARVDAGLAVGLLDNALGSAVRLLNRLEHVTFSSVSRRLAMILWMRRELLFDARRPLLSRPQLADLAGTSREMAGRVIRDFEQRGLIARVGVTGLILKDPIGLRAAAGIDKGDVSRIGR